MKKVILVFVGVTTMLFVVAMCVSGRSNVASRHDVQVDGVNVVKDPDTAIPDSVINLLMVRMPDSVPQQLLVRRGYITSYNKATLLPNWVAWRLTADNVDGQWQRVKQYHEDEEVPEPRAVPEDYRGCGNMGLSRGHMCPAADNKWDRKAIYEANALTNICPQDRSMNSGVWNSVEMDCRKWARRYGEIYVVCGPLLLRGEHQRIGRNGVVVPEAFFKVVLCLTGKPKAFGIIVRNNDGTHKRDLYYNSVDQVERIMGMDFFAALPDDIEEAVEARLDMDEWR